MGEILLIYVGVVTAIKGLYELRDIPLVERYLSMVVAVILIYTPILHVGFRRIQVTFFEKTFSGLIRSFFYFVVTSIVIFPPFLIANHLYQKVFFERGPDLSAWNLSFGPILVQLFLVALPEELFFRGYLQTLIAKRTVYRIVFTSLLFALAHSIIAFQWWHFAIFFPALVFGWLREKTNGLLAPILFHAVSNVIVAWIGMVYT